MQKQSDQMTHSSETTNLTVTPSQEDAGSKTADHYKSLPPYRFRLRNKCLPLVRKETEVLSKIQANIRNPVLDYYFAWTANLASHTFYVLMLPLSNWFGSAELARDLVFVLGFGIYLSGNLKDFLCLPRPRSPPLHRITLSSYTTQEYGFPSSHSANATAVSLLLANKLIHMNVELSTKIIGLIVIAVYYVSLIFGRIYCGMHGFFDVLTGSTIGFVLFLFRYSLGKQWDDVFVLDVGNRFGLMMPVVVISIYLFLIHIHFEPVDNCPCFDDSVAFIGVLIGLDLSHWLAFKSLYFVGGVMQTDVNPIIISYDYNQIGLFKSILRVSIGIISVLLWKTFSKPIVFTILPPIYKALKMNLPRKNYQATAFSTKSNKHIRRTSISNLNAEQEKFIGKAKDQVGVQSDIDYYEMLHYQGKQPERSAQVFKPRYDVEIIGRLIIYAGISIVSVWGFAILTTTLGLN